MAVCISLLYFVVLHEEIFSKTHELGAVEFLCPVFPVRPGMALVLSSQLVVLVFQFLQPHHYIRWF